MKKAVLITMLMTLFLAIEGNAQTGVQRELERQRVDRLNWERSDAERRGIEGGYSPSSTPALPAPTNPPQFPIPSNGNVTIPEGTTSIENSAFALYSNLRSVTIPASVTSIGRGAFTGCINLTSINVDADNAAYESVDGVLFTKGRTVLIQYLVGKQNSSYTIPASVTSIGRGAFGFCTNLASITIPASVTSIGESAFGFCTNLTSITIPASVTSIGDFAFSNCRSLRTVTLSRRTTIGTDAFPANTRITYSD